MDELEELENLLDQLLEGIANAIQSGEELSDDFQLQLADEIQSTYSRIEELRAESEIPPTEAPTSNPPSVNQGLGPSPTPASQLLWILAGQQEEPFISYLREFPSQETQSLLSNPQELSRVITFLNRMMPQGTPPTIGDIQHSDLNSSNVWGSKYDPHTEKLTVRFQGGKEYEYDAVPEYIYRAFQKGSASARTNGRNQYGVWWVGKSPSLGAALNQYIKAGGFSYRRIR